MRKVLSIFLMMTLFISVNAQTALKKVYDENVNPLEQIDKAITKAQAEKKHVVCQVGGNWCPWCLRFADFIEKDTAIANVIAQHYVYIHVNYDPRKVDNSTEASMLMKRLNNPARFGFPVFVILNEKGEVIHIQDSSFLEEGQGYSHDRVLRFFNCWIPEAV